MPARWSRTHSSAKILSMKRSSRVSLVSQCKTSLLECAVAGTMFGGAFISCSRAVTWIDGTGYVVSPLDGVNGVRRNLLARIGLSVGYRVSGARGRSGSTAPSLSIHNSPLQFEGPSTCDCGSHELRLDRDVAVRRPRIRTHLVRCLDQALRYVGRDAGQADVQADRDIEAVTVRSEVDLCIDREVGRQHDLDPAG